MQETRIHPEAGRERDSLDPVMPSGYNTDHSAGLLVNPEEYLPSATLSHSECQEESGMTDPIVEIQEDGDTPSWSKTLRHILQPNTCNIQNREWPLRRAKAAHFFWEICGDQIPFPQSAPTRPAQYGIRSVGLNPWKIRKQPSNSSNNRRSSGLDCLVMTRAWIF